MFLQRSVYGKVSVLWGRWMLSRWICGSRQLNLMENNLFLYTLLLRRWYKIQRLDTDMIIATEGLLSAKVNHTGTTLYRIRCRMEGQQEWGWNIKQLLNSTRLSASASEKYRTMGRPSNCSQLVKSILGSTLIQDSPKFASWLGSQCMWMSMERVGLSPGRL